MHVVVFGAGGRTGRHVVGQALARGHHVTAVMRRSSPAEPPGSTVVRVPAVVEAEVAPIVAGSDAVVSAIGPHGRGPTSVTTDTTTAIVRGMRASGARRLLLVSNSGMITEGDPWAMRMLVKPLLGRFLRHAFADATGAERVVRASRLDWTLVRPPRLTDRPHTGVYRTDSGGNVLGGRSISRADLADFVVGILGDGGTHHRAISIGY